MAKIEIIWIVCGVVALIVCFIMAIQQKRWRWFFLISWPIIMMLGPIGLMAALGEWCGNRSCRAPN